jgi:hypothetical protein
LEHRYGVLHDLPYISRRDIGIGYLLKACGRLDQLSIIFLLFFRFTAQITNTRGLKLNSSAFLLEAYLAFPLAKKGTWSAISKKESLTKRGGEGEETILRRGRGVTIQDEQIT